MTRRSAFTLIELLISVALVLILVLGVNQVFSIASKGVGAGQAMSTVVRDNRAASSIIYEDLRLSDFENAPFITITSHVIPAFLDDPDQKGDLDGNILTRDFNGDNNENSNALETSRYAAPDPRVHRADIFNFFMSGGQFRRTTGNDTEFVNSLTSQEAWVSYGHVKMWDHTGTVDVAGAYKDPGAVAPNPDNFFARDWILGRMPIILVQPTLTPPAVTPGILDQRGVDQRHLIQTAATILPISQMAASDQNMQGASGLRAFRTEEARLDLAAMTLATAASELRSAIPATPGWYNQFNYRFFCNPYIVKPHTSRQMAQAAPFFIQGCTQFTVEYAGDFLLQTPATGAVERWYGQVKTPPEIAAGVENTDKQIDFVVTPTGRKVRWYGMPRNVDTSDDLPLSAGPLAAGPMVKGTGADVTGGFSTYLDVVPLRDMIRTAPAGGPGFPGAPFERVMPAAKANYAATAATGMLAADTYLCAWGPDDIVRPKMIRITVTLDDLNGRLSEGQTYEYVVQLP